MAMDIERANYEVRDDHENESKVAANRSINWWLVAVNMACVATGTIGGPLLVRVYFLHGGSRTWLSSWLQTGGCPILLGPLSVAYMKQKSKGERFLVEPKLMLVSAVIGLLLGLDNYMYSHGLSYLPVSTSSLLLATQLAFTALFALIIVRQRFTPFSVNAVVLMLLGSVLLGLRKSSDRPPGVTNSQYLLGFVITIGAAGLLGFLLPCIELAYAKFKTINYTVIMQFQFGVTFFATVFCTVGMLVNKDFQAMSREAKLFEIGESKYYMVIVGAAVVFQLLYIGSLGLIFCTSSLFAGVVISTLLPLTEIAAVIVFKEKFTGEKGMALALCLWGFISYFYGDYRAQKQQKQNILAQIDETK